MCLRQYCCWSHQFYQKKLHNRHFQSQRMTFISLFNGFSQAILIHNNPLLGLKSHIFRHVCAVVSEIHYFRCLCSVLVSKTRSNGHRKYDLCVLSGQDGDSNTGVNQATAPFLTTCGLADEMHKSLES